MITQTLKLNLIPGQVLPRVNVSQYDAGTRTLQMLLYNGDQAFNIPVGYGGFVQGTKPDRTGFQYAATVTEGSNVVTLVVTQQMAAVSGEVTCELVIANGNDRIATVNFILYVEPAALSDDTVISDTDLPLLQEAVEAAAEAEASAIAAASSESAAEDSAEDAEAYAVGTRNGTDVTSGDPAYHNNAKYYAESVSSAIEDLDVTDTAVSGSYVTAVSETDGLISVTREAADNTPTASSSKMVTSDGIKSYVDDSIAALDVSDSAVAGSYVTAVSETDGSISVTREAADATPTESSTKMVTSGGIYSSEKAIYEVMGQNGAVNALKNGLTTNTKYGVTLTVNDDKSMILSTESGGATAWTQFDFPDYVTGLAAGKTYKLTLGVQNKPYINGVRINLTKRSGGSETSVGYATPSEDLEFTPSSGDVYALNLSVSSGTIITTAITINAMVRLASDTDDTYQPYAMTNRELTEEINGGFILINRRYKVAEVTADGTKTNATLLAELCSATSTAVGQIASNLRIKLDCISISGYDSMIIPAQSLLTNANTVSTISAFVIHTTGSGMKIETVIGRSSNSRFREVEINVSDGNITPTNGDSVVPTNGNKFYVYAELYRSVS